MDTCEARHDRLSRPAQAAERAEVTCTVAHAPAEQATDLAVEPNSAGRARRFVGATLALWSLEDLSDETILLTSEIVTNAILHTDSTSIRLRVVLLSDGVRVEVGDGSPHAPVVRRHSPASGTGRGLALVEASARRWGADAHGDGKTVWFEIATA